MMTRGMLMARHVVWALTCTLCAVVFAACQANVPTDSTDTTQENSAIIGAHTVRVGYRGDLDGFTTSIETLDEWYELLGTLGFEGYVEAEDVVASNKSCDLPSYDEAYFVEGSRLLVAYQDLGSSGYAADVVGVDASGEVATVHIDRNVQEDRAYTADMDGFVAVVEVPVGANLTHIEFDIV